MNPRDLVRSRSGQWRRLALGLWIVAAYLGLLYAALRWGGHSPDPNILPSAD